MSNVKPKKLPVNVSPLIKAARWILLMSGVYFGEKKKSLLIRLDKPRKIVRKTKAIERHLREKLESDKTAEAGLKELASHFGIKLPKHFLSSE